MSVPLKTEVRAGIPWSSEAVTRRILSALHPESFVARYTAWGATRTDGPLVYHVGGALAIMAAVAPPALRLTGLPGIEQPANEFIMLVGDQGSSRKTTCGDLAIKSALGGAAKLAGQHGCQLNVVGQHPTGLEGFVDEVGDKPQAVFYYPDFGALLMQTAERKGGNYASAIKGKLLEAFDCSPLGRRRANGRPSIHVQDPRISLFGGVNLALLTENTTPQDIEGGLLSRFITILAARERTANIEVIPEEDDANLADVRLRIAQFGVQGSQFGPCIGLTPRARALRRLWAYDIEASLAHALDVTKCGAQARADTHSRRIALLFGMGNGYGWGGRAWRIDAPTMLAALQMATVSYQSALAVARRADDSLETRDMRRAFAAIDPKDGALLSTILQTTGFGRRRCETALDTLTSRGDVMGVMEVAPPGVSRPSTDTLRYFRLVSQEAEWWREMIAPTTKWLSVKPDDLPGLGETDDALSN